MPNVETIGKEWAWLFDGLTLARWRLTLSPREPFSPPRYPGVMLRGALGRALMLLDGPWHRSTEDRFQQIYRPVGHKQAADRQVDIPPPYLIEWPRALGPVEPGERWFFDVTLIGPATGQAERILDSANLAAETGLGEKRVPHRMDAAEIVSATSKPAPLREHVRGAQALSREVEVDLVTPFRPGKRRDPVPDLTFTKIFEMLQRRARMVANFHGDTPPPPRTDDLHDLARSVRLDSKRAKWVKLDRASQRQDNKIALDGIVGSLRLSGDLGPFSPLLLAGSVLHLGRYITHGHGRIRLLTEGQEVRDLEDRLNSTTYGDSSREGVSPPARKGVGTRSWGRKW